MVIGIEASNIIAGGGVTHLKELLCHFKPENNDQIIVWSTTGTLEKLPNHSWIAKVTHKHLNKGIIQRFIWSKFLFKKEITKYNCDVLFSPGGTLSINFPYVSMSQNMLVFDDYERKGFGFSFTLFRLKLLEYIQANSLKKSIGNIFISNYARDFISKKINLNSKSAIIHHGISKRFECKPKEQFDISHYVDIKYKLLYVSTIDFYKHQFEVIEAVKLLIDEGVNLELTLVGSYGKSYYEKIKNSIDGINIIYKGVVDFEEIHKIYLASDGFIFASSCENMPNILLEAMSAGLPIISSNSQPMPEFLKENCFYFNPYSIEDIKLRIIEFLKSPDMRYSKSIKGFEDVSNYNWEICADKTFNFIKKVKSNEC